MTSEFVYVAHPARVIFGEGTIAQVEDEARELGIKRPMVLTTPAQKDDGRRLAARLDLDEKALFSGATMHTPVHVTEKALSQFEAIGADGTIAFGGGSTIGLGKAIAYRKDTPQLVVPTTYAGSEMTALLGETEDGRKKTFSSPRVLPETVIYDVDLTLGLPRQMTVTSGMNAMAHAVEALYAENGNPVLSLMAEEGIRALTSALAHLADGALDDRAARRDALYGAWLCATCLGLSGVALHHKICHVLGGSFDTPHAETHTIVLPHALAYNAPAVPQAMERLRRATGSKTPAAYLFDIAKAAGVPTTLADLGLKREDLPKIIEVTLENPYYNPRALEREPLQELLVNALEGRRPEW